MFGCGIAHVIAQAPKDEHFSIMLNIITPHVPITSDGKAPNLEIFFDDITGAISTAVRKARRPGASGRQTQKDVVLDHLKEAIAKVSSNGRHRFNQRQILYALRPIVKAELDKELTTENFAQVITYYESERGEIPGMYREPRGSIYHPHRGETKTLGTLMVEGYERPEWTFNKLLYIEKEGFSEMLKDERWGEKHDCAEARFEDQVAEAIAAIEKPDAAALEDGIEELFEEQPDAQRRDHITAIAEELSDEAE